MFLITPITHRSSFKSIQKTILMSTIMASLCCSRHNKIYNGMFIVKKHCQEANLNKYTSKCWEQTTIFNVFMLTAEIWNTAYHRLFASRIDYLLYMVLINSRWDRTTAVFRRITRVMSPQLSQLSYRVLVPPHVLAFHTQFSPVMNQGALL